MSVPSPLHDAPPQLKANLEGETPTQKLYPSLEGQRALMKAEHRLYKDGTASDFISVFSL